MKSLNTILLSLLFALTPNFSFAATYIKGGALIEEPTSITSASGTTTLTAASETFNVVTGTLPQTIVLPSGLTLKNGRSFIIRNESTGLVTVNANGGTLLRNLAPNEQSVIRLRSGSTAAGTWAVENNAAVNVAQATYFGGITQNGATSCNYGETTSSGPTNFITLAGASGCNAWTVKPGGTGTVAGIAANTQGIILTNVPAGTLTVSLKAGISNNNNSAICNFRIYDGTSGYDPQFLYVGATSGVSIPTLQFTVPVTTPQSSLTLQVQASGGAGGNCAIDNAVAGRGAAFDVTYFPSQAQSVVRMDQTNYDWRSYTPTFTGFGTVSGVNCREKRDGADNVIDCTFTPGTSTAVEARMSLPGSNVSSSSLPTLSFAGYGVINVAGPGQFVVLKEPSVGYITFGIQYASGAGLAKQNGNAVLSSGQTYSFTARVPIQGWTENQSAPLLSGGVTSSSTGMEMINRAEVTAACTASPCTISYQSGSWLTSVTRTAAGSYTINAAAGICSGQLRCNLQQIGNNLIPYRTGTPSATTWSWIQTNIASSNTDGAFEIQCGCSR